MGKYGFIYLTENLVNGKKYIGQRKYSNGWEYYLGSGIVLMRSITKYGRENFKRTILCEANDKDELNELEIRCIKIYNAVEDPNYYNSSPGGSGGNTYINKTDNEMNEIVEKIRVTKSKQTEEQVKNISEKMSKSLKGRTFIDETKEKMSESKKGKRTAAKKVKCLETGEVFDSALDAAKKLNCNRQFITDVCKGKRKIHKGYTFEFVNEEETHHDN